MIMLFFLSCTLQDVDVGSFGYSREKIGDKNENYKEQKGKTAHQ